MNTRTSDCRLRPKIFPDETGESRRGDRTGSARSQMQPKELVLCSIRNLYAAQLRRNKLQGRNCGFIES